MNLPILNILNVIGLKSTDGFVHMQLLHTFLNYFSQIYNVFDIQY